MVTGERQSGRIRRMYLKTILRQDVAFFDKETNTGEVVGRMSGDTVLIQDAMGEKVLITVTKKSRNDLQTFLHLLLNTKSFLILLGWKIYTAYVNIHWRFCNSICKRVASHPCHVNLYSSHGNSWWHHGSLNRKDGFPRTKCLCKSSSCG